jgi:hypothetical protein
MSSQGDVIYASGANTPARLAKSTTSTQYLANTGSSNNPAWNEVALDTGVSGTLPVGNGGTGATSLTANGAIIGNGSSALTSIDMSTKGGLLAGDGSGNPRVLAVGGTADHVLTVDSGEATGMKWAAAGGGNLEAAAQGFVEAGTYSLFTALGPFPVGTTISQGSLIGFGKTFIAYETSGGTIAHSTTVRGGWDLGTSNDADVAAISFGGYASALQVSDDWTVVWRCNIAGTLTDLRLHMGWTTSNPGAHGQDNDNNQIGFVQTGTANMFAVVDSSGSETTHDHGSNINTNASFRIEVREGGSQASFYINNSIVGSTVTSGLPSSSAMNFNINVDGDGATDAHVHLSDLFAWREV